MKVSIILVLISVFIIHSANAGGYYGKRDEHNIEEDPEFQYETDKIPPSIDLEYLRGPVGDPGYLTFFRNLFYLNLNINFLSNKNFRTRWYGFFLSVYILK